LQNKKVILTSGRLAKRKGVAWFIRNVLPRLDNNVIYVVAGNGPDRENILQAIQETHLENRVKMLGYIEDSVRDMLFYTCDIFVQPNIPVTGDMEGFGISVIEAAYCGIPVIAANLEGLKDAIKHNQNGFLVETKNAEAYLSQINPLLNDDSYRKQFGQKARQFVMDNFSWSNISKQYIAEIKKTINHKI
jgi:phosphatidylinositol alpha-1,6-mannosyltransferase